MGYKSARLLVEAIHREMDEVRKLLMVNPADDNMNDVSLANSEAQEKLIDLRKLFDELAAMADRPTIDGVLGMSPTDYVITMKPLVAKYHRSLMVADALAPALCEDLQANACVLILMGDGKTIIRTAHNPARPEVALAVEILLAAIDASTKQVVEEGVAEAENKLGLVEQPLEQEDEEPLRVKYFDRIIEEDRERNEKAVFVVDENDVVIKDLERGDVGRKATPEEIERCIIVKDPGSGVGYGDDV